MKKNKKNIYKSIIILFFFFLNNATYSQEVLIKNGDKWSYYDNGYLESNWHKNQNFNDWKTGISPLGYGDNQIATTISFGDNPKKKEIIKYFSKTINIKDISNFKGYEFKLLRDDGAVIYLNGEELYRENMYNGTVTNSTVAKTFVDNEQEQTYYVKVFDSSIFKQGDNTINIQIHQSSEDSSDCIFSLELIAHTDPSILIDVVNEQIETKDVLESKIDILNYSFILKNTITQLEIYKNSNQNLYFLLAVVGGLLIITIIGSFIVYFKNRNNENVFNNTIQKLNNEVLENEKQMISFSTQLLHYKQYLKEIKADLNFIKTDNTKALNNTIKQIDFILESNDEWEQLKLHFDTVFSGFYDNLLSKCPTLTETELRHCMFIKLHIQTKEIARILNVDPRSVQTARYRIKKKLDLSEDQDLRNFLITI
ncbi:helix-turn-helix transcriptional regulator [Polaribacter uvawellassae]|uniref:helix-turn-helix transcriptional regulator n=1 Tax=Polaribacter uvawellassae TaxID=3133495 RepID=UPI003219E7FF